jgi:anti-sigma regulatory factor (Ser/Thr protein kinase)
MVTAGDDAPMTGRTIRPVPNQVTLPPHPASVGRARKFLLECLHSAGIHEVDDPQLVVSELVTNAVIHARTEIVVRVLPGDDGGVRVEVIDGSTAMPGPRLATTASHDGRGLTLVDHFTPKWGVDRIPSGKAVWFLVPPDGS